MILSGKNRFNQRPKTVLNTQQAHSLKEWVSLHSDFLQDLGDIREYIDLNIKVSLAKDFE